MQEYVTEGGAPANSAGSAGMEPPSPSADHNPHPPTTAPAESATRRVGVLQRSTPRKYVEGMRNMGWIAGLVHRVSDDLVLVQQTNNPETAIPVRLASKRWKANQLHMRLLTMEVRLYGQRDDHGPQCYAELVSIEQPSLLDLPTSKVWASGFGKDPQMQETLKELMRDKVALFDEHGQLKPEFQRFVREVKDEATGESAWHVTAETQRYIDGIRMFGDMAEASGNVIDSRIGAGRNYVSIAGFLDAKSFINPTEHRKGYGLLLVRQHADQARNIPVRVTDARAAQLFRSKQLIEGVPLLINGSLRRKVYPSNDDPTKIASVHTFIECVSVQDVKPGRLMVDILKTPDWWTEIRDRLEARRAQREAQRAAQSQQIGQQIEVKPPIRVIEGL